jgi:hypothetical protein
MAVSSLRPETVACEMRVRMWLPLRLGVGGPSQRVLDVLHQGWALSTRRLYGAALGTYHAFCDNQSPRVPERERGPASESLILDFISACVGLYSSACVRNYVYGIRAWHTLHRLPWAISDDVLTTAFRAAAQLQPSSSTKDLRDPVTVESMMVVGAYLNMDDSFDAAVWACMTTTFWSVSRLGEFTVEKIAGFDPERHIKRSDVHLDVQAGRDSLQVTTFLIPATKAAIRGETAQWAVQDGPCDPRAAILNHFRVNNPSPSMHLFTWRHRSGLWPMTKTAFLKRVNEALAASGFPPIKGHCLRIGGVLEFLLRGTPFDVVKVLGRWSSDAFETYLRDFASILAPYIQATPVHDHLARLVSIPRRIRR